MKKVIEGNLILPTQVIYGQVVIEGELIAKIITEKKDFLTPDIVINSDNFLSPGFIDIQINGAFGKEFKTDEDAIEVISNKIYKFGVTSFCPTVTTSELSKYNTFVLKLIENHKSKAGTKFLGLHFEGPALNPQKVGAQNASLLKTPNELDLDLYLNPKVKMVTFSPELNGANEFITELLKRKIKIGFGHSTINYEKVTEIFDENNMLIVHLFNAMDGLSSREPGLVGAGMANDNYYLSVIPDGIHLHPQTLNIVWKSKENKRKLICISDGSAVLGLEIGTYQIGERTIIKSETTATLPSGTLVGSILTLNRAVKNLMSFCNASLSEAVNTVSLNPATYLGLENEIGQIKEGNKADLVVLNSDMNVEKTFINGGLIYER